MARSIEINQLTWDDVDFDRKCVTLYTRKKKGGNRTPRKVPMTERLFQILQRRYRSRDPELPWVFWHSYFSKKTGQMERGPYQDRKKFMKTLCRKAGVRYFRFHALRHSGASLMDLNHVDLGSIQRILGHENRRTTEIYLHSIGTPEKDAIAVLESLTIKNSQSPSQSPSQGIKKGPTQIG
jgi:integrase